MTGGVDNLRHQVPVGDVGRRARRQVERQTEQRLDDLERGGISQKWYLDDQIINNKEIANYATQTKHASNY